MPISLEIESLDDFRYNKNASTHLLDITTSFAVMLIASLACGAWYGYRFGKHFALGAGMAISLLAGSWFQITIGDTMVHVPVVVALVLLIVYCLHSWREIFRTIHVLDFFVGALVIWQCFVDIAYDGQPFANAALAYGHWMLPYAAGRYAFLHKDALTHLSPLFAVVAAIISVGAITEAFTETNLWEWLFVEADDRITRVRSVRYGLLYRAMGPVRNPIFLGIILLLMIPFAIDWGCRSAPKSSLRWSSYLVVVLIACGIVATVSRGPVLCLPVVALFALAYRYRPIRWFIGVALPITIIGIALNLPTVLEWAEYDGSENSRRLIVDLDQREAPDIYTGTRQRLYVPMIYGPIVWRGGPMGYGTVNSSGFPPYNIPGLPTDPDVLHRIRNIDNAYINIGLFFGWTGLFFFVGLISSAVYLASAWAESASTYLYPSDWRVMVALAACCFAMALELTTIHWFYDYSFWVMFLMGVVGGLSVRCRQTRQGIASQ